MGKLLLLLITLVPGTIFAQQTGKVDYEYLGLSFVVPDQWFGQETEGGYVMGSNTIPGRILLLPHDKTYSVDELTAMARQGLNEGDGTYLTLNGDLEKIGEDAVGGVFTGTLNYEQAKGYILGLSNNFGNGITIIAITSPQAFNEKYRDYALEVKNGIDFYKPETDNIVNEWKQFLTNYRLTFMESYNSNSGGMVSGYNIQRKIDLCGGGYFNYQSNNNMSINTDGAFGSGSGNNKGAGTWQIIVDASGNAMLRLNYYSGETYDYKLTYTNEKLYLNDERYFRTNSGENSPSCY